MAEQGLKPGKRAVAAIIAQVLLLFLFLFFLYVVLGPEISISQKTFQFNFSQNDSDFFALGLTGFALLVLFVFSQKKMPDAKSLQDETSDLIKSTFKQKIGFAKEDPRIAALVLIEAVFAVFIALVIAAYLDPEYRIIDWQSRGITEPYSTLFNVVIFVALVVVFLFLYRYTSFYRKEFTSNAPAQNLAKRIGKK